MKRPASQKEIAAATAYEDLHVPAVFRQWAPWVADAAKIRPGDRVLDVGCGTGVLAREVSSRLADDGVVVGLDPDPGMLAVARRLEPGIEWWEGQADSIPCADDFFDAVISQFGLMFFQDRLAALREMLRVLAPSGRMAVAVWDSLERSEAYPIEVELLERFAGRQAADALRAPFVLGERAELTRLFQKAGAVSVEATTLHGVARFPSVRTMVNADLRGWLPVMGVHLSETQVASILQAAEERLSPYVTEDGTAEFDIPAHIVTAAKSSSPG